MKIIRLLLMATLISATLSACDDKLADSVTDIEPIITISMPDDMQNASIVDEKIQVTNVSTRQTATYSSRSGIKLITGLYDISYDASVSVSGDTTVRHIKAYSPSVEISAAKHDVALSTFEAESNDDFIISEIFFTGTLRSTGNQYYGDDYVKIYNNTDHVLYADGLALVESKFTTTQKYNYRPDIMDTAMTVQAIYVIPGSGKDHPVQPGESLLLADTGIDHRVANPYSFDLSKADFEWYDVSTVPAHMDIDSPTVPNLDKWYCYTLSFFVLHNRGFRAYALVRFPVDKDTYLNNYRYTYDYEIIVTAGTFPMSQTAYYVPNKWIVDAVNCSVAASYTWNVTSPKLDRGWTFCGTMDHDKSRYFHAVRRKMLYLKDGHPFLKDTNNSTEDFNAYVIPSEIERQGTAVDINGTLCKQLTWDGVTPIK